MPTRFQAALPKKSVMKLFLFILIPLVAALGLTAAADVWVSRSSAPYLADRPDSLPAHKTALLLGTTPTLADGRANPYFDYRIQAAAELWKSGKVRHIIASGDNRKHSYNEPDAMKAALIAQGVPPENITPDYAGLRTLDSVLRARDIFGQEGYIVVSQKFHNERAVYLARAHGIPAYGFNARDVATRAGLKTRLREYGARIKMFIDLATGRQPRHGGGRITLPD